MLRSICIALAMLACAAFLSTTFAADTPMSGATATIKPSQAAATQPSNKDVTGTLSFAQQDQDVHVTGDLTGLSPGKHGIHIHAKADMSDPQLKSAGPHWDNGGKHHHGGPDVAEHHTGDLGNITADDSGKAHVDAMLKNVKLDDLNGKSVIIHAGEDDLKSDPAGNSGGRVAGGEIVVSK
jgi:Cu-Zn family superoxide dismutase